MRSVAAKAGRTEAAVGLALPAFAHERSGTSQTRERRAAAACGWTAARALLR
ncbi:MAG: hypothetical protein IPO91_25440 [Chloroflexi bacterium]|nr:hypothetical protein [Chloroflexota bacterium]